MKKTLFIVSFLIVFIGGCGGSGTNVQAPIADSANLPVGDFELLFIGNSHSSNNGLPALVATLIEVGDPAKKANASLAPGWAFLDERIGDGVTQEALEARPWTHVFLQAQKYSTTGQYSYPIGAAVEWVKRVKQRNALPVMFPEWPRRGNREEGLRVYQLHLSIAAQEAACVAPVGLVWDEFILQYPGINLHAGDGNHSNLKGALLTAYIFYQIVTNKNAIELPFVPEINVSESVQQKLREVASEFYGTHLPCP